MFEPKSVLSNHKAAPSHKEGELSFRKKRSHALPGGLVSGSPSPCSRAWPSGRLSTPPLSGDSISARGLPPRGPCFQNARLPTVPGLLSRRPPPSLVNSPPTPGFPPGYPASEGVALGAVGYLSGWPPPSLANSPPTPGFPPGYPTPEEIAPDCTGVPLGMAFAFAGERPSHAEVFPAGASRSRRGCSRCGGVSFRSRNYHVNRSGD